MLVTKLAYDILALMRDYPEYRTQVEATFGGDHGLIRVGSTPLLKTIGGTSIFGIKPAVAKMIDKQLRSFELEPWSSTLQFKPGEVTILIACDQPKDEAPYSDKACTYIAKKIAQKLQANMAYKVVGQGKYSTYTRAVMLSFSQKVK